MRNGSEVVKGPGGRDVLREPGQPDKVALPMHVGADACTLDEKKLLIRFTDASELAKGNYAVITIDGQPRGRYAQYAEKVSPETYARYEISAYQWIMREAFGSDAGILAEMVARMNGQRVETTFQQWGLYVTNSDNPDIQAGGAIGSMRALAWMLKDAYRDFAEFWRIRQEAAREGRALSPEENVQRVRRGRTVREAIAAERRKLVAEKGKNQA